MAKDKEKKEKKEEATKEEAVELTENELEEVAGGMRILETGSPTIPVVGGVTSGVDIGQQTMPKVSTEFQDGDDLILITDPQKR